MNKVFLASGNCTMMVSRWISGKVVLSFCGGSFFDDFPGHFENDLFSNNYMKYRPRSISDLYEHKCYKKYYCETFVHTIY